MQIFLLDADRWVSSALMCDQHVCKILVEIVQLLYTSIHIARRPVVWPIEPYKPISNPNHPVAKWVRRSFKNFRYALGLADSIAKEYETRFRRVHACKKHVRAFLENIDWYGSFEDMPPVGDMRGCVLATADLPFGLADFPLCFADHEPRLVRRNAAGQVLGISSFRLYYASKMNTFPMRWFSMSSVTPSVFDRAAHRLDRLRGGLVDLSDNVDGVSAEHDASNLAELTSLKFKDFIKSGRRERCPFIQPGFVIAFLEVDEIRARDRRRAARKTIKLLRALLRQHALVCFWQKLTYAPGGQGLERASKRFRALQDNGGPTFPAAGVCNAIAHV